MARNKNKGFTLIEVVIAIAILTILITPILKQFSATMYTNRKAKEQQHANENAEYVLEYYQKSSMEVLESVDNTQEIYCQAAPTVAQADCKLYTIDPSTGEVSDTPLAIYNEASNLYDLDAVTYNIRTYTLNDVKITGSQTTYSRTVVLDDLNNKIMAAKVDGDKSYRIDYGMTAANIGSSDFVLTSEGSLVKYDATGTYVEAIVCKEIGAYSDKAVTDPNEINLGNMHDLDATKIPIITGSATNFDVQAEKDLYAKAMERMKVADPEKWKAQMLGTNTGYLSTYGYVNGLKKLTKIYVDEGMDDEGKEYFIVKVDVYYENEVAQNIATDEVVDGNRNDKLTYNVFSQLFYKEDVGEDCPDIYMEYQPFSTDSYGNNIFYAEKEYIIMDCHIENSDKDGDGNPDPVKMYLYKPQWDQANAYAVDVKTYGYDDSLLVDVESVYYVNNETDNNKVNIFINNASASSDKYVDIYTNLPAEHVNTSIEEPDPQFTCNELILYFSYVVSDKVGASAVRAVYKEQYIHPLSEDEFFEDRLYTVTVKLTPDDDRANTVILTGAKGVN